MERRDVVLTAMTELVNLATDAVTTLQKTPADSQIDDVEATAMLLAVTLGVKRTLTEMELKLEIAEELKLKLIGAMMRGDLPPEAPLPAGSSAG